MVHQGGPSGGSIRGVRGYAFPEYIEEIKVIWCFSLNKGHLQHSKRGVCTPSPDKINLLYDNVMFIRVNLHRGRIINPTYVILVNVCDDVRCLLTRYFLSFIYLHFSDWTSAVQNYV